MNVTIPVIQQETIIFHLPKPDHKPDHPKGIDAKMELVEKIMDKLRKADRNKDGRYSKDELKNALKELGAIFPGWRANRCLVKADANHDGQISEEEIDTLLEYLLSRGFGK